jgi:hypothetical protein
VERRNVTILALLVIAMAGCQSPASPTGPAPQPSAGPASSGASGTGQPILSLDELRNPGPPLKLALTEDRGHAVSETIGPDGGSVTATGADGTTYRLDVPAETLLFDTEITLTPLSDVAGLPFDQQPEHRIGVELGPEGLEFATPVTLTMSPPEAIPTGGAAVLGFQAGGEDATLNSFDVNAGAATVQLSHFSGASAFWPLHDEWWRIIARSKARDLVRQIQAAIAADVGEARFHQLRGTESDSLLDIALKWAPAWDELVFQPALDRANAGCREATDAVLAYVIWERQLQLMGLRDPETGASDPRLARPIPDSLLILKRDLCFEEQFQRCRDTGDFKSLMAFFLAHFRQLEVLGAEINQDEIDLAQLYLERCGRWDFDVSTRSSLSASSGSESEKVTYHFKIAWHPGSAVYGLAYSSATAQADVSIDAIEESRPDCRIVISQAQSTQQGFASIKDIDFDQLEDQPPVPRQLKIEFQPGAIGWDETAYCGSGGGGQTAHGVTDWPELAAAIGGDPNAHSLVLDNGWSFDRDPFAADLTKAGSVEIRKVRLDATLTHTPAP